MDPKKPIYQPKAREREIRPTDSFDVQYFKTVGPFVDEIIEEAEKSIADREREKANLIQRLYRQ